MAQPLLSLLGANPTFFVAHRIQGFDLILYAAALVLVPALTLWAVVAAVSVASKKAAGFVQLIFLGILASFALTPPIARFLGGAIVIWIVLGVSVTVATALAIRRFSPVRSVVRALAFAPLLFMGLFLFTSPASSLLSGADHDGGLAVGEDGTPSVVWLILDQFPMSFVVDEDGQLMAERYPNLARLAEISTWYPNAVAGTVRTDMAVPAALSGTWPSWDQLPVASQHPRNLFTILGRDSYPVHAEEYVTQMCPDSLCGKSKRESSMWSDTTAVYVRYLLPESVADRFVPRVDDRWDGFGDTGDTYVAGEAKDKDEIVRLRNRVDENSVRFGRFLEPLAAQQLNGIHYAHLFLPHEPFRYLPDGRIMSVSHLIKTDEEGRWPDDEPTMRSRLPRMLSQTLYADHLVGEFLDTLEASGNLDRTLLVVMSDHGASSRPGVINRSPTDPDSMIDSVPEMIFIKAPGQTDGTIDTRRAQQVDILPTVLDLLGVDADLPSLDGLAMVPSEDRKWQSREPVQITEQGSRPMRTPPDARTSPTITWLDRIFPHPGDPFRMRPFAGIVGSSIDVGALDRSAYRVSLDEPDLWTNVDTSGPTLPATISGTLPEMATPDGAFIAAVLNGRIAGVGESFSNDGHRFSILMDPEVFVHGTNSVELLITDPVRNDEWDTLETRSIQWERLSQG